MTAFRELTTLAQASLDAFRTRDDQSLDSASASLENSGGSNPRFLILTFSGDEALVERLQEVGFRRGDEIELVGRAPFFGPFLYRLGATVIALREEEAHCLRVHIL